MNTQNKTDLNISKYIIRKTTFFCIHKSSMDNWLMTGLGLTSICRPYPSKGALQYINLKPFCYGSKT